MKSSSVIAAVLVSISVGAFAQTVYESRDKAGRPVFSDTPSAGASAVQLPPPNVVVMPSVEPAAPTTQAPPAYRSLVVLHPAEQATVHSNTGAFDVKARLSPPLRGGDRIAVSIDGTLLKQRFRSPNLHISEADWRAAANDDSNAHSLQLIVVDAKGEPMIESASVSFYRQRASALLPPRR